MTKFFLMGASALLAATAAPAQDVHMFVFNVHAADLTDPAALQARIGRAIDQGCGTYAGTEFHEWGAVGRCRKAAKVSSDRQIAEAIKRRDATRLASAR